MDRLRTVYILFRNVLNIVVEKLPCLFMRLEIQTAPVSRMQIQMGVVKRELPLVEIYTDTVSSILGS